MNARTLFASHQLASVTRWRWGYLMCRWFFLLYYFWSNSSVHRRLTERDVMQLLTNRRRCDATVCRTAHYPSDGHRSLNISKIDAASQKPTRSVGNGRRTAVDPFPMDRGRCFASTAAYKGLYRPYTRAGETSMRRRLPTLIWYPSVCACAVVILANVETRCIARCEKSCADEK